ncbi:MAG: hypothetical protein WCP58_11905, partial [bacterium]
MTQRWKLFLAGALAFGLLLAPLSVLPAVGMETTLSGDTSAAAVNPPPDNPPNPQPEGGSQGYSLEQAMSDNAQLSTIAFSG